MAIDKLIIRGVMKGSSTMKIEVKQSWIDTIPCHFTVRRGGVLEGATNEYLQALTDFSIVAFRIIDNRLGLRGKQNVVIGGEGQ